MGDLLLGPVVDATVAKVIDVATEQFNLAWGWKADLKKFCRIMEMLRSVLQDADEKNVIGTHSHFRSWLLELRAIADEADDVLEEVSYANLRRRVADQIPKRKKVSYFFSQSNPLVFRLRMANKVKSLNLNLADINDSAIRLGLQYKLATTGFEPVVGPQQTYSFLPSQVIGRDKDVPEIESLLLNSTSSQEQELPVIAIVGMTGLGKTTLAQKVSKAEKILEKFGEHVIWVSVSTNFENKLILKEMLESSTNDARESSAENAMKKIQEELGEKCYLLILDDVWNEERQKWEALRSCLLGISKNKGNRVLVTTRSENVARVMTHTGHTYFPKILEDEECWVIIKQRAFGSSSFPKEFEVVGREISQKCRGVPLVASLIGATLQNRRDIREWRSILRNHVWHSLERENGVLDIIRLSYDRLPELALKQCFAFCSVFPKDFVMEKEALIQLWMAEGYLASSEDSSTRMEDIGEKYYRYLLSYSLFQDESIDYWGKRVTCKMHDLIHDFAESISTSETAILDKESENKLLSSIRHLNLICGGKMMPTISEDVAPKLRTLFLKHDAPNGVQLDYKRLRVLKVSKASDGEQLSKCFGNSKSLRYLDISGTKVEEFPKFIKKLYNLQTFRFVDCKALRMPPDGVGNLINLRHIYFDDEDRMPVNLGRLTNLQTLCLFFVGTTKGRKIEELGSLSRLNGKLDIRNLELVKGNSEAESAKLHEKELYELILSWSRSGSGDCDEDILEGLQPHSSLQKLHLQYYGGKGLASWMLKSEGRFHLNNLVVLRLDRCVKLKSIPLMKVFSSLEELYINDCEELTDGEFAFQSLKKLSIEYCSKVESLTFSGLTSLEELEIYDCGVVNIIGDDLSSCTSLRILEMKYCRKLKNIPGLQGLLSLQKVTIHECREVACLPSGLSSCTGLEVLSIEFCPNLVSIPEDMKRLHSLVELKIKMCSKLSSFPEEMLGFLSKLKSLDIGGFSNELEEFPGFKSINNLSACLQNLELYGWEKLTQLPHQIQALTSLKSLDIGYFNGVKALPEWLGQLSSLKALTVIGCSELRSLNLISIPGGLKELRSLVHLNIFYCQKLRSFPQEILGSLTSLNSLTLGKFSEDLEEFIGLSSIPHHLHSSLEELTLYGWKKLTQLPQQIQHLTALRELTIEDFNGVEALPDWLGNLPSLQSLRIYHCGNLKILPSAQVIKRLSKLNKIIINPDLLELKEKIYQEKRSSAV